MGRCFPCTLFLPCKRIEAMAITCGTSDEAVENVLVRLNPAIREVG